jgi:hypothetical protein
MPKVALKANAEIDVLSKDELEDSLKGYFAAREAARLRGIKHLSRIPVLSGTIASNAILLPASGDPTQCGPHQGYAWSVRRLTIDGLTTAADVVAIYRSSKDAVNRVAQFTGAAPVVTFNKGAFVLQPGDTIACANVGNLTTTGVLTVTGEATEVPAELLGKLVG